MLALPAPITTEPPRIGSAGGIGASRPTAAPRPAADEADAVASDARRVEERAPRRFTLVEGRPDAAGSTSGRRSADADGLFGALGRGFVSARFLAQRLFAEVIGSGLTLEPFAEIAGLYRRADSLGTGPAQPRGGAVDLSV